MNENKLRLQGVRLASLSMFMGCTLFTIITILPILLAEDESSVLGIVSLLVMTMLAYSLLALPFSMIGGYALAWLLQKAQWYKHHHTKVVISGVLIGSITLLVLYVIGVILSSFFQGETGGDIITELQGVLRSVEFMKASGIAAICGGVVAWRLSRLAQQKTA